MQIIFAAALTWPFIKPSEPLLDLKGITIGLTVPTQIREGYFVKNDRQDPDEFLSL